MARDELEMGFDHKREINRIISATSPAVVDAQLTRKLLKLIFLFRIRQPKIFVGHLTSSDLHVDEYHELLEFGCHAFLSTYYGSLSVGDSSNLTCFINMVTKIILTLPGYFRFVRLRSV